MIVRLTRAPRRYAATSFEPTARSPIPNRERRKITSLTATTPTATMKAIGIGPICEVSVSVTLAL